MDWESLYKEQVSNSSDSLRRGGGLCGWSKCCVSVGVDHGSQPLKSLIQLRSEDIVLDYGMSAHGVGFVLLLFLN